MGSYGEVGGGGFGGGSISRKQAVNRGGGRYQNADGGRGSESKVSEGVWGGKLPCFSEGYASVCGGACSSCGFDHSLVRNLNAVGYGVAEVGNSKKGG